MRLWRGGSEGRAECLLSRKRLIFILLVTSTAEICFRIANWGWLRSVTRSYVLVLCRGELSHMGRQDVAGFLIDDLPYVMNNRCTYADLLCLTIPFILSRSGVRTNVARVVVWCGFVFLINGMRIGFACKMRSEGISWFWAHTVVDYGIRTLIILCIGRLWLLQFRTPVPGGDCSQKELE